MTILDAQLSQSAFIANISPREKTPWRVIVTLLSGIVAGFVVGLLIGLIALLAIGAAFGVFNGDIHALPQRIEALIGTNGASLASALTVLTLALATNGPWAAVFLLLAALIMGRNVLSYITAAPAFRWRLLLAGLVLSMIILAPLIAVSQLTDPHAPQAPILALAPDWPSRIGYGVACILLLTPAAAAEEVVFRGWLLRQTAAVTRNPYVLMAVSGLLFSAAHGEFAPDAFLTRALMGAGFAYMTLRLGGVEFSTGAHAANNIMIVLFIQPLSLTPSPSAGLTLESLFQDLFLFASYIVMAELVARWPALRRWTGVDRAAVRPPAIAAAEHFS